MRQEDANSNITLKNVLYYIKLLVDLLQTSFQQFFSF